MTKEEFIGILVLLGFKEEYTGIYKMGELSVLIQTSKFSPRYRSMPYNVMSKEETLKQIEVELTKGEIND